MLSRDPLLPGPGLVLESDKWPLGLLSSSHPGPSRDVPVP